MALNTNKREGDKLHAEEWNELVQKVQGKQSRLNIVDALDSTSSTDVLSAKQGNILNSKIEDIKASAQGVEAVVKTLPVGYFYGTFTIEEELPSEISEKGYAYVGTAPNYVIYTYEPTIGWSITNNKYGTSPLETDLETKSQTKAPTTKAVQEGIENSDITIAKVSGGELTTTQKYNASANINDRVPVITIDESTQTQILESRGYKVLDPSKSFASQVENIVEDDVTIVDNSNTVFEIKDKFDLNGETVELPNNCTLKFNGGLLTNGTIKPNQTSIDAASVKIFDNISITSGYSMLGSLNMCWLGAKQGNSDYDNSVHVNDWYNNYCTVFKKCEFPQGTYYFKTPLSFTEVTSKRFSTIDGNYSLFYFEKPNEQEESHAFITISVENFTLMNVRIVSNEEKDVSKCEGIFLNQATRINLTNITIEGFFIGVKLRKMWYGGFNGNNMIYNCTKGIYADESSGGISSELNNFKFSNIVLRTSFSPENAFKRVTVMAGNDSIIKSNEIEQKTIGSYKYAVADTIIEDNPYFVTSQIGDFRLIKSVKTYIGNTSNYSEEETIIKPNYYNDSNRKCSTIYDLNDPGINVEYYVAAYLSSSSSDTLSYTVTNDDETTSHSFQLNTSVINVIVNDGTSAYNYAIDTVNLPTFKPGSIITSTDSRLRFIMKVTTVGNSTPKYYLYNKTGTTTYSITLPDDLYVSIKKTYKCAKYLGASSGTYESPANIKIIKGDEYLYNKTRIVGIDIHTFMGNITFDGVSIECVDVGIRTNWQGLSTEYRERSNFEIRNSYFEKINAHSIYIGKGYVESQNSTKFYIWDTTGYIHNCRFNSTINNNANNLIYLFGGNFTVTNNISPKKITLSAYGSISIPTFITMDNSDLQIDSVSYNPFVRIRRIIDRYTVQNGTSTYNDTKRILNMENDDCYYLPITTFNNNENTTNNNSYSYSPYKVSTHSIVGIHLTNSIYPYTIIKDKLQKQSGNNIISKSFNANYASISQRTNGELLSTFLSEWKNGVAKEYTYGVQGLFSYGVKTEPEQGIVKRISNNTIVAYGLKRSVESDVVSITGFAKPTVNSASTWIFVDGMLYVQTSNSRHKFLCDIAQCGLDNKEIIPDNITALSSTNGKYFSVTTSSDIALTDIRTFLNAISFDSTNNILKIYNGYEWTDLVNPTDRYVYVDNGKSISLRMSMAELPGQTFFNEATGITYTFGVKNNTIKTPYWRSSVGEVDSLEHPNGYDASSNPISYSTELSAGEAVICNCKLYIWGGQAWKDANGNYLSNIQVSDRSVLLQADANSSQTIEVYTSDTPTPTVDANASGWLSASLIGNILTITATANTSNNPRGGKIILTNTNDEVVINVVQNYV